MPRRGSLLTTATSSSIVCVPSPTTCPGTRFATATSSPSTTSMRWSWPAMNVSTMTLRLMACACRKATAT